MTANNYVNFEKKIYRPGVGAMIFNRQDGSIFAGRRADTKHSALQMPQGGIDPGEKPEQTLYRELEEEIGTDKVRIIQTSKKWYSYSFPPPIANRLYGGKYMGQEQKWFLVEFTGQDTDIHLDTKNREFLNWRWVHIDELINVCIAFKRSVYRQVIDEFKPTLMSRFKNIQHNKDDTVDAVY